jgi:hypothetical protein
MLLCRVKMTEMHNAGCSIEPLLLERHSQSDGLMESEAAKIAETLMCLIAKMGEVDLGKEWLASSRHLMFTKASATRSNQRMDKNSRDVQLKI